MINFKVNCRKFRLSSLDTLLLLLLLCRRLRLLSGGARCGVPVPGRALLRHHPPAPQRLAPPLAKTLARRSNGYRGDSGDGLPRGALTLGDRPLLWPYWDYDPTPLAGGGVTVRRGADAWRTNLREGTRPSIQNKLSQAAQA